MDIGQIRDIVTLRLMNEWPRDTPSYRDRRDESLTTPFPQNFPSVPTPESSRTSKKIQPGSFSYM
jgi:hypothetical protein